MASVTARFHIEALRKLYFLRLHQYLRKRCVDTDDVLTLEVLTDQSVTRVMVVF